MRDRDIRYILRKQLSRSCGDDPSTLIVDELGICSGNARVDLAVVNGELKGFEIKSERDTLARLPSQVHLYGKVFDTMTIVLGPRHLRDVESFTPHWWGIVVASRDQDGLMDLEKIRDETENTSQDALSLAQLLWRDEALALLCGAGLARGLRGRPRRYLWEALTANFSLFEMRTIVREQLKTRKNWRVARLRKPCDGRSPLSAKLSDSLYPAGASRIR